MTKAPKPNGPLSGWIEATSELMAEQLTGVTRLLNETIDKQKNHFDALQARGASVDARLRSALSPATVLTTMEQLVKANPVWTLLPDFDRRPSKRTLQLDALSAKVDALTEKVALLAEKEARSNAENVVSASVTGRASGDEAMLEKDIIEANVVLAREKPSRRPSTRKKTVASAPKKPGRAAVSSMGSKNAGR